ncbi:TolC family protein [Hydrogenobacter sp. Uz 6-8]|jgi:outer membrane protein TolC|uniref:TolC family protein n=1 Tax=Hydrogenobacter sp. Uz 6-8 TaxID=3384828 RepID=UPI0038FC88EE
MILILFIFSFSGAGELEVLIKYALDNSPALKTYQHMKKSAEYRERYSKSLPNPSAYLGLNNLPLNRPYPSKYESMSSLSVGFSQMYVLPTKREREALTARVEGEIFRLQEEVAKRELIREIKLRYLEWLYTYKREELYRNILSEIRSLEKLTEENYRLGRANLSELLSLKAEALKVERDMRNLLEDRRILKVELDSLVGKSFELRGEEPAIQEVDLEALNAEKSPYLKVVSEEIEKLKAEVERRRVEYLPDAEFMAEYMIRPGLENMFSLRVSVSLPLRRSVREELMVLEKLEELRAKELERERLRLQLRKEIQALKVEEVRVEGLRNLTQRLVEEKENELKALQIAYTFGKADFRDILRLYRELWELRMNLLELELERKRIKVRAEVYL